MPKAGKKAKPHPKPTVVHTPVAITTPTGGSKTVMKNYTRNKLQDVMNREMKAWRPVSLTPDEAKKFMQMREMRDKGPGCSENEDIITYDDVAQGNVRIEISHAGGEMEALAADLNMTVNGERTLHATRSRRDAVQHEVLGFQAQMKFGLDGDYTLPAPNEIEGTYKIEVVDIFILPHKAPGTYTMEVPMTGNDVYLSSCVMAQGLIPATPWKPKVAFTTRCLEIYRLVCLRSPGVSIQPWVKTLADLHGCKLKPYVSKAFSKCFYVYLKVLQVVDDRIKKVLGRDAPDWRLKNCCPACTYKLEGEMKMIFEMLFTLDGNDSLKCILVKDKTVDENGAAHGRGKEQDDPRTADAGRNYLMMREDVDKWSKEVLATLVKCPRSKDKAEDTECQERWKNMSEELTAKMWGISDETGVFLALYCHGFFLLVADMVRISKVWPHYNQSASPGFWTRPWDWLRHWLWFLVDKAMNLKILVGTFHGHAHNRSCQLKHLATYVLGLGLEDLETCERFFSKSNGLARAVRMFPIGVKRNELMTMPLLGTFLVNNYKQALEQIDLEDSLKFAMNQAGISGPGVFEERLKQEQYSSGRIHSQWNCTLAPQRELKPSSAGCAGDGEEDGYLSPVDEALVASRHYRLAPNKLEELVIKRLFELTKMTMSGTGYKLRKHIAKALQTRSKTIRTALVRYNAAATSLDPPRCTVKWEEVVEFTFLPDFDLLRDLEGNAAIRPWATPAARALMDTHFKILRAKEEIQRLNIKIRRLVTYIRDEWDFLVAKEEEIRETDPDLAFFCPQRLRKLQATYKEQFTGTLEPGVRRKEPEIPTQMVVDDQQAQREALEAEMHTVLADDGDEEEEEEELARAIETVVVLATDETD
ncbi:hypothetical protein B0H14DRAFT_2647720 [Mycena olivaceomarginata]|nr:hypothetical protein B0H14DRAFT_2647720 [Mycena olivaceomarginata]